MTTYNISVTGAWTKVADAADENVLVTWENPVMLEVATTSADTAPTVVGHRLTRDSGITRKALSDGYIWLKVVPGYGAANSATVIVDK